MLGYAEQSTFSHAFKRWPALTPGEWRQNTNRNSLATSSLSG